MGELVPAPGLCTSIPIWRGPALGLKPARVPHMDLAGSWPSASAAGYLLWHLWRSGVRVFIRALVCSVLLPAVGFGVIRPSIPGLTLYSKIFADLTAFVKIYRWGSFIFWAPSFFLSRETILAPAYLPSEAGNYQDPERALGCSLSG